MARLAPCGWQVGLPAIQLTASDYLDLDIGDDRVYTLWSGCRTEMTLWITAWWHVVQECVLLAVFTVNAGCWRLRPCYAYGRPDDAGCNGLDRWASTGFENLVQNVWRN